MLKVLFINLLGFSGLGMMFYGLWMFDPAIAFTVIGACLAGLAVAVARAT